jgi:hypothetical protein
MVPNGASDAEPELLFGVADPLRMTRDLSCMMSSIYTFGLPTTGSLSFADHFSDGLDVYTTHIANATQARANLRAVLKESKHTDGDKDYLRLVKASLVLGLQS